MKTVNLILIFVLLLLISAFVLLRPKSHMGSVKGQVRPEDAGYRACAVGTDGDTTRADITGGVFKIAMLEPGIYRLVIQAHPPYQHSIRNG